MTKPTVKELKEELNRLHAAVEQLRRAITALAEAEVDGPAGALRARVRAALQEENR